MNYLKNSNFLVIRALTHFISFSPLKILLVNLGSVLQAVSASIGLLLMIPLAQLAGVDFQGQGDSPWGFLTYISDFINQLGFTQNLGQILLVYSILVTLVAVLSYIRTMIGINIQLGYTKQTRMEVYNAMLSARWEYLASSRSSEFLHRLGTQVQSMSAVANSSISLLHKFVSLGVYTAVMFALNWQFTLLTIACGVIIGIILLPIRWSVRNAGQRRLIGYQNIFRLLSEHLGSLKMIKASGLEWQFQEQLRTVSDDLELQQVVTTRAGAIISFANTIGMAIGFCVMLYFAVTWLNVPIANFFLLLMIMSRLMPQIAGLQQSVQQIIYLIPSYRDIEETIKSSKEMNEAALTNSVNRLGLTYGISLNNVSYQYPSAQRDIVSKLNLFIPVNNTLALVGPSGAGKTSTADLLVGLLQPTKGEVRIDDEHLTGKKIGEWRRSIAYVTQETYLFNDSIRNNLKWVKPQVSDDEVWAAIKQAALFDCINALPQKLDSVIGDRGVRLSGGERQRLAIARALLSQPDLLVLDEATSALDDGNEKLIQKALINIHGSLTVVIIAHRKTTIEHADMMLDLSGDTPKLTNHENTN